uniref:Uncharacterized protein n=1 Tax=Lepeophtheirus salmonis TaxID=72036 RepID=A0A0K2TMU8_LEPSM
MECGRLPGNQMVLNTNYLTMICTLLRINLVNLTTSIMAKLSSIMVDNSSNNQIEVPKNVINSCVDYGLLEGVIDGQGSRYEGK